MAQSLTAHLAPLMVATIGLALGLTSIALFD
ncbi:hypothetical protein Thimo_1452 [Thioflavicoccus mobilis 8321]|uniref:Uncharacterized protein n=1 Tax=Thioflavicoccus mobilis 8321 TaxID=765912 RepID=L0GWN8_9GAMM|nr:hypothetical protein Thimo_1452 [Thioflavicoccus mobilis 8321]